MTHSNKPEPGSQDEMRAAFEVFTRSSSCRIPAGTTLDSEQFRIGQEAFQAGAQWQASRVAPVAQAVPDGWRAAIQKFVDRCDAGEVLSKRTYAEFKELLAAPSAPQAVAAPDRDSALEEAAQACDVIDKDCFDQYKGRGKYAPNNPNRADTHYDGMSNGAAMCAEAIRELKQAPQPIVAPAAEATPCGVRDYCGRFPFCGCGAAPVMPERDTSKPAEQQGVFRKFDVRRVDGSDAPGGKHHGCRYFVLDIDHDEFVPAALRAYAEKCAPTHPHLAAELVAEFGASQQPVPPQSLLEIMDEVRRIGATKTNKEILDSLGWQKIKQQPVSALSAGFIPMNDPLEDEQVENLSAILDAYESGIGHGLKDDGHKDGPYSLRTCSVAYGVGYDEGLERAAISAQLVQQRATLSDAARDVLAERQRQISIEGWTPKHDDQHDCHEMAEAAACYAYPELITAVGIHVWPWNPGWWKPKDRRSNLIRAGALLLAEIERIDRAILAATGAA